MITKVLLTGRNSYIGKNIANFLKEYEHFDVDIISIRDDEWKSKDFSKFDVIIHLAAIVHKKETSSNTSSYDLINRDLTFDLANKAKKDGSRQFILFSTMSVFGAEEGIINKHTKLSPSTKYGVSKLEAEVLIKKLETDNFTISIIRPPMVYGKNCVGNYKLLSKLANYVPIYPNINNSRSMIYITNLCNFVKIIIEKKLSGVFHPQNLDYVNTNEMIKEIRSYSGKKTIYSKTIYYIINIINPKIKILKKIYGNLCYDKSFSNLEFDYNKTGFSTSIKISETKDNAK